MLCLLEKFLSGSWRFKPFSVFYETHEITEVLWNKFCKVVDPWMRFRATPRTGRCFCLKNHQIIDVSWWSGNEGVDTLFVFSRSMYGYTNVLASLSRYLAKEGNIAHRLQNFLPLGCFLFQIYLKFYWILFNLLKIQSPLTNNFDFHKTVFLCLTIVSLDLYSEIVVTYIHKNVTWYILYDFKNVRWRFFCIGTARCESIQPPPPP